MAVITDTPHGTAEQINERHSVQKFTTEWKNHISKGNATETAWKILDNEGYFDRPESFATRDEAVAFVEHLAADRAAAIAENARITGGATVDTSGPATDAQKSLIVKLERERGVPQDVEGSVALPPLSRMTKAEASWYIDAFKR